MTLNLTIGVTDLGSSEAFYRDLLGLRVAFKHRDEGGPYLLVDCGNCQLVLQPITSLMATHPLLFQNFFRQQPGNGVQFELTCSDLDEVMKCLERHQWPVHYELEDQEHGRRELWVKDPDGYLLVLNKE